jgi:hypothetical protein
MLLRLTLGELLTLDENVNRYAILGESGLIS